jgi:hypothetical protein
MAAIGQGAGGGAGAPGGDGGAGAPPSATGTPPAGAAPNTDNDPFGFAQAVASAPEHLRDMLQTEFNRVTPTLTERLGKYQPVEERWDRLSPLLEAGEDGSTVLDGLLEFYSMTGDENRLEDFNDWWDKVGETYGFFGDEEGDGEGDGAGAGAGGEGAAAASGDEDPRDARIAQLEARLGEFETRSQQAAQQQKVDQAAQQISTELTTLMTKLGIDGHDAENPLQSDAAQDILAIAMRYGEDPQAIPKAVDRFLRISGRGQTELVNNAGQDVSGLEALQGLLNGGTGGAPSQPAPGPALGRGNADHKPPPVKGWDEATALARERMRTGRV